MSTALRVGATFGILVVAAAGCAPGPAERLQARVPKLEPEFARHLVADDDSSLAAFCRQAGWSRTYWATWLLGQRDPTSPEAFARSEEGKLPYSRRIHRVLDTAFGLEGQARFALALMDEPLERRYQRARHLDRIRVASLDTLAPPGDREARLLALMQGCGEGGERCRLEALLALASIQLEIGNPRKFLDYHRAALEVALRTGFQPMSCQLLGGQGEIMRQRGELDSMAYFWQTGLDLALHHHLVDQAARLCVFFGNHHRDRGRWALAGDYLRTARRLCREPGAQVDGLRTLLESLEFPARLGCWDLVARELRVVGAETREAQAAGSPLVGILEPLVLEYRALDEARRGNVAAADRLYAQADERYERAGGRLPRRARLLARWARALVVAGWKASAVRVARRGLDYSRAYKIPEEVPANALVLARASMAVEDRETWRSALETFHATASGRSDVPARDWIEFDALQARLHAAAGDREGMLRALHAGLTRLESSVVEMDASPESYLFLSGQNDLRDLMHELVADSPEVGYRIERRWRRATALLRASEPMGDLPACADLVARHLGERDRPLPASYPGAPAPDSAIQVLYYVGERVLRWTVGPHGIRRDVVPVSSRQLEGTVLDLVGLMAADPGDADHPIEVALQSDLRSLGHLLLPPEVRDAVETAVPRTLQVFADGVLGRLPFEALNLSRTGYRPVMAGWDVVYVRGSGVAPKPPTEGSGLVVADPEVSARLDRLHGGIPRLGFGLAEARQLAEEDPSTRLLSGRAATKRALTGAWEKAGYLFFATHVVEDFEAPYSSFIPMAADTISAGIEGEYLEIADVLGANLERCRLVVLSGCASGVSRPFAGPAGPSLAGAFLDAGARAAIRTAWPVRDDHAASLMGEFIRLWKVDGIPAARALNEAKRRQMLGRHGYRHPVSWAAYAMDLGQASGAD
jgi:hypothetical protein